MKRRVVNKKRKRSPDLSREAEISVFDGYRFIETVSPHGNGTSTCEWRLAWSVGGEDTILTDEPVASATFDLSETSAKNYLRLKSILDAVEKLIAFGADPAILFSVTERVAKFLGDFTVEGYEWISSTSQVDHLFAKSGGKGPPERLLEISPGKEVLVVSDELLASTRYRMSINRSLQHLKLISPSEDFFKLDIDEGGNVIDVVGQA